MEEGGGHSVLPLPLPSNFMKTNSRTPVCLPAVCVCVCVEGGYVCVSVISG